MMEILEVNLEGALNNVDGLHTFYFEEVLHKKDENDPLMQTPDGAGICKFFLKGTCQKGHQCQFRHSKSERSIVCKHWLRYYSSQIFTFSSFSHFVVEHCVRREMHANFYIDMIYHECQSASFSLNLVFSLLKSSQCNQLLIIPS